MRRGTQVVSRRLVLVVVACFGSGTSPMASGANDAVMLEVSQGTVTFEVGTNVPALRVHGKSNAIKARARVGLGPEGAAVLEYIEASVPVKSLGTGLELRDEHMRKYIFTRPDGQVPDLRFSAERIACPKMGSGQRMKCEVSGELVIRETARPFTIALTLIEEHGDFRAAGDGIVKLSAYGIEQPSQLGVRTADDVKLRLEFTARRPASQVAARSGDR